ncbi:hypothetical protein PM8797T_01684 [Gimesia maris DSM 8797]|nr:hypothetical protein PM8797T_01684 [Gimesia maris DSM 8797]
MILYFKIRNRKPVNPSVRIQAEIVQKLLSI